MQKYLPLLILTLFYSIIKGQVISISPLSSFQNQTITAKIVLAPGVMQAGNPPASVTDIYLDQAGSRIYTDVFSTAQIYPGLPPYDDSLLTNFTIPFNAILGWYDVHVITYTVPFNQPVDNVLLNGFLIPAVGSCPVPFGITSDTLTGTSELIGWSPTVIADTFRIRYRLHGTNSYQYKDINGTGGIHSDTLNNLLPSILYDLDISTICNGIHSTYSVPVDTFTTLTQTMNCVVPFGISITNITSTSMQINWSNLAVSDTFRIRYNVLGSTNYRYQDVNGAAPHFLIISSLRPASTYEFRISSKCLGTFTGYSAVYSGATLAGTIPCAIPYDLDTIGLTNTGITVIWTPNVNADTFRVNYRMLSGGPDYYVNVSGLFPHNAVLSNLIPNTTYFFKVSSICSGSSSGYSPPEYFTTINSPAQCAVPYALNATGITNVSAVLNWSNMVSADTFRIRYAVNGTTNYNYKNSPGSSGSSTSITGLVANTTYKYQVTSICSGIGSGYSAAATFTTTSSTVSCAVPYGLGVTSITNSSALVSWTNLVSADTFRIRYYVNGNTNYFYKNVSGTAPHSTTLSGLLPNTSYLFQVSSVCVGYGSGYSASLGFLTTNNPVNCTAVPYGLSTSNITNSSAAISWTPLVTADSFLIRYAVTGTTNYLWKKVSGSGGNSTTLTGLSPVTNYQWQVRTACNGAPLTPYSALSFFGTPLRLSHNSFENEVDFSLFPNPAVEKFNIQFYAEETESVLIRLFDISGKIILNDYLQAIIGKNSFEYSTLNLPAGIYTFQMVCGEKIYREKLLVVSR